MPSAPSRPHYTSERAGGLEQPGISSRLGPVLHWEGTLFSFNVPCPWPLPLHSTD